MIEARNLSYTYESENNFKTSAVENISFSVNNGEILGILGKTGSGKSTLVQMLNGLLKPLSGEIILNGKNITTDFKNKYEVFSKIGLVFQYPEHQLFESTVFDDIAFGLKNQGLEKPEIHSRVIKIANMLGLNENLLSRSPLSLSGGEKRRCAIAGVMALKPDVLILDEPTAGMDLIGKNFLLKCLLDYHSQEKRSIILISHSVEEIIEVSSKILVLDKGKSVYYGSPGGLFKKDIKYLESLGLNPAQITQVMSLVKAEGYDIPESVLTVNQAQKEILKLLEKDGATA